jgi:hypothetical protein
MATRNTISRITSRIDDLTERLTPDREPITIIRTLGENPMLRAANIGSTAQRRVMVINTGVPRGDPDPEYCTRESVAAALPEAKASIAGRREWAERRRSAEGDTRHDLGRSRRTVRRG